ncbi:hypothetical protein [Micromonospora haikouensis]|uniref:hypothetical protein n=1 Tax=Micromonospora haikouensis TaxID=686309 RepID=UPI003D712589
MKTRPASTQAVLCATCYVLVGQQNGQWRHVALLDRSRYTTCDSPSPGRPAKAYEVERGHGQPAH